MSKQKCYILQKEYTLDAFEECLYQLLNKISETSDAASKIKIISKREEYIDASAYYLALDCRLHYSTDKKYEYKTEGLIDTPDYKVNLTQVLHFKSEADGDWTTLYYIKCNKLSSSTYDGEKIDDLALKVPEINKHLVNPFMLEANDSELINMSNELTNEGTNYIIDHYHDESHWIFDRRFNQEATFCIRIPIYVIEYEAFGKTYKFSALPSCYGYTPSTDGLVNLKTKREFNKNYYFKPIRLTIALVLMSIIAFYAYWFYYDFNSNPNHYILTIALGIVSLLLLAFTFVRYNKDIKGRWNMIMKNHYTDNFEPKKKKNFNFERSLTEEENIE